jgi:DNA-directed RNA polymerase specialized sigma24 family protein
MPTTDTTHPHGPNGQPVPVDELVSATFRAERAFTATEPTVKMEFVDDAELLGMLASDGPSQRAAIAELYARYSSYLNTVAARAARKLDPHELADVVTDSLLAASAWVRRQSPAISICEQFTPADGGPGHHCVRPWLSAIVRRVAVARARALARSPLQALDYDVAAPDETAEESEPPPSPRMLELELRLAHLRPKVRSALLESMPWYEPGSSQFAMARGESQRLAEELGVSADVVRQWRWRALRQLRASMVSCASA